MKKNTQVWRCLTMISQVSIHMLVPIFLCAFVGIWLDRKLGTSFCMVVQFFVGALAGFRNVYLLIMKINGKNKAWHDELSEKD